MSTDSIDLIVIGSHTYIYYLHLLPPYQSSQHNTPGIEATTGPLGAGIGNAVGMAAAAKMAAAKYVDMSID